MEDPATNDNYSHKSASLTASMLFFFRLSPQPTFKLLSLAPYGLWMGDQHAGQPHLRGKDEGTKGGTWEGIGGGKQRSEGARDHRRGRL